MRPLCFVLLAACAPATYRVPPPAPAPGPSGQTYCQAIEVTCDVDPRAQITDADVVLLDQQRSSYLEANVDNPEGVYLKPGPTIGRKPSDLDRVAAVR